MNKVGKLYKDSISTFVFGSNVSERSGLDDIPKSNTNIKVKCAFSGGEHTVIIDLDNVWTLGCNTTGFRWD
jgi:hypothetical protein